MTTTTNVYYSPWKKEKVCIVNTEHECGAAVTELKSQLFEYNVISLHCEVDEKSSRILLLQIATYHGDVMLFRFCNYKDFPIELKKLLEDDKVVKVDSGLAGQRLVNYGVNVASAFDLFSLSTLCGCKYRKLKKMCWTYLKKRLHYKSLFRTKNWKAVDLDEEQISLAVTYVRAGIELFKFFARKLEPQLDAERIRFVIEKHCSQFFYTAKKRPKPQKPKPQAPKRIIKTKGKDFIDYSNGQSIRTYVPLESNYCDNMLEKLETCCGDYNIIGFDCEVDIHSMKNDKRMAMLNMASYDGTCVFIKLSEKLTTSSPSILKKLLEDDHIIKVGIAPQHAASKLKRFGIQATSMFDLRYIAEMCGVQPETMLRTLTENQSVLTSNNDLASHAEAYVKLFQVFVNKLQPEVPQQPSIEGGMCARNIIEKFCIENLNKDYREKEDKLKVESIHIIEDANLCPQTMKEIKIHCAEYNVLGLDCEWVSCSNVALLQLATHRGFCLLVRLCCLEKLPLELKEILEDANIIKVGKDVYNDANKLRVQFGAQVASILDVGGMAVKCGFRDGGLGSMTESFLNTKPYKTKRISCSNWEKERLTERQIIYAAKDAQAGIELFKFFAETMDMNLPFDVGTDYVNRVIDKHFANLLISNTMGVV